MIKYSYALENGYPVHINNVTELSRKESKYTCVCCGEQMAAHIKGKRKPHFQHYRETQHNYETYLHLTAKKVVKQAYENALKDNLPVHIEYEQKRFCNAHKLTTSIPCDYGSVIKKFDITQTHKEIYEESAVGGFIPDLHLKSEVHPEIFIEIFVTHKSEQEKIKSGFRIIEIKIEREEDLQGLYPLNFLKSNKKLSFYNFSTKPVTASFCNEKDYGCGVHHYYYVIMTGANSYELGYDALGYVTGIINSHSADKYLLRKVEEGDYNYSNNDILSALLDEMRRTFKLYIKSCYECVHFTNKLYSASTVEHSHCRKLMEDISTVAKAVHCSEYELTKRRF